MNRFLKIAAALLLLLPGAARLKAEFPQAYVYVDVKFTILVKSDGETIPRTGNPVTYFNPANSTHVAAANQQADDMLSSLNQISVNPVMDNNWRGLRYRRYGNVDFVKASDGNSTFQGRVDSLFRSYYDPGFAGDSAYTAFDPFGKLAEWGPEDTAAWKWTEAAANFYLIGGFGGGVGTFPGNLMVQGGFWVDPATHELGHWFSLPHTFRVGGGQGQAVCYWGDDISSLDHADGFTDTLIDHVGCVISLDDVAGRFYKKPDGSPKKFSELTNPQKDFARTWFRDFYAEEFFSASSYDVLLASQKLRIPPYDDALTAPTAADRDRFAVHMYGMTYATLRPENQAVIDNGIANPNAELWYGYTAAWLIWNFRVDDDLIAEHNFGVFYDQTNATQREQMRQLNANIIAYRAGKGSPYGIFSEQQNDRLCDLISGYDTGLGGHRGPTRSSSSGRYVFLGGAQDGTKPFGSSLNPHSSLLSLALSAPANSVIIARPGSYSRPEPTSFSISKPMTIRATKAGPVTIGN